MKYIPIRICSAKKSKVKSGYLRDIYIRAHLQNFSKAFNEYAILSRKYGICLWNKVYDNYSDSEMKEDAELLELLKKQHDSDEFKDFAFIYYFTEGIHRHRRWIKLLKDAGFKVSGSHDLDQIKYMLAKKQSSKSSIDQWMKKE
jgi:hypothetical protein